MAWLLRQVNCQSKLLGEHKCYVAAHPITRWHSERRVTPSPTSTTSPATSVPRMFGYFWMYLPVSCVVQVRDSAETSGLLQRSIHTWIFQSTGLTATA